MTISCSGLNGGYTGSGNSADCRKLSKPNMVNNLFWQNRSFSVNLVDQYGNVITPGNTNPTGTGLQSQQNLIALTPALVQRATGQCPAGANVWDIGLRTDDVNSGFIPPSTRLALNNSLYTGDAKTAIVVGGSGSANNQTPAATPLVAAFCNGARMPPEHCTDGGIDNGSPSCKGYNAPVGASETTGLTQVFVFSGIQPTATVDEGHNWLNLSFGPLTLSRPNVSTPTPGELMLVSRASGLGTTLGAYSITRGSAAVGNGAAGNSLPAGAVRTAVGADFFGNTRPINGSTKLDIGAVTLTAAAAGSASVRPTALTFGAVAVGSSSTQTITLSAGSTALTGVSVSTAAIPDGAPNPFSVSGCVGIVAANATCTISVVFTPIDSSAATGTLTVTATAGGPILGLPVALTGNGVVLDLNLTPSSVVFTPLVDNTTSPTQNITLTNLSAGAITGINPAVAGTGFMLTTPTAGTACGASGFTLAAGASCTVGAAFAPTVTGSASGSLSVTAATPLGVRIAGPVTLIGVGLAPPPVISIAPTSGYSNSTVAVTLTGSYLSGATSVNVTGTGITVGNFVIVDDSHITTTFAIANGAAATVRNVTVVTPGGTSNVATFTVVTPPQPTLTGLVPSAGVRPTSPSTNYTVVLTGTNLNLPGTTLTEGSANFSIANYTVNSATQITATVTVFSNTSIGQKTLTVTTLGGTATVSFTVYSATGAAVLFTSESGVASLNAAGTTLAFGNQTGSQTDTVTVTIGGTTAVSFGTATVANGTPAAFSKGADTCSGNTKSPGSTCTISVIFNGPNGNNARTGTLSVPYAGATGSPRNLALTGS